MEKKKEEILKFMREESGRPLAFREIVRALDVRKDQRDSIKGFLKEMIADGALVRISGGRFGLPSKLNLITGELICHPDGYGFVRPEGGRGEDIFINPGRLNGAMHGDIVAARVEGVKSGGRKEGSIIRVIRRAHKTIVGRYEEGGKGFGAIIPSDRRITSEIIVPPGDRGNAAHGMIVSAEITRWPAKHIPAAGRVAEIIGEPEDPDVEAEVILRKFGLPHRFPAHVLHEAKGVPDSVGEEDIKGRVDLRGKTTVTIDGETAKDFDDAVSVEKTRHGFRLYVSIADVSRYVKEGTVIDTEAYARGTSVYFPGRCIPMLPEALSNGICSLNPRVDRLAMTAELEFDSNGVPVKKSFYESVINSVERLTYTTVKGLLSEGEGDSELKARYGHILEDIRLMRGLAEKLSVRRIEAGSIDFDLPEPQIIIDIEGRIEDIVRSERNVAHRIIEEFMLSANRAVAEEFSRQKLPFLYRVHGAPDDESINDFREFVKGFGLDFRPDKGPASFQNVLLGVKGRPEEKLINHVLLRSMKQAAYSPGNTGHFGLAFDDYTHFTSPIRRYPDLVVHRLLKLLMQKRYLRQEQERMEATLPAIASHTSMRERKAMEAEREIVDLKKAQFMKDKEGKVFSGFVSGVTSFGAFVELKDYFVEALVHVSTLRDDYYIFDAKKHMLFGENTKRTLRVGVGLKVKITRVDIERRRIDAELMEDGPQGEVRKGARDKRGREMKRGRRR